MYIPEGYGTVFPYMVVDGADRLVEFLTRVFDAELAGKTVLPDGRAANVRVRVGTSTFMISEASEQMRAMPAAYYVYVEDVDRTYARALDAGAHSVFEPADMPYQDRQAGVSDPAGNLWWISRRLLEAPYDS